ncbi:MAG: aminotransferase class I/II-fold pyridoxal phosphate-dependent enzyme [Clostridia bacterium]|nr:aminotransferase class I/II-fold pyridoxal phosphate-dependent enzyme [Clostridia bacterium]
MKSYKEMTKQELEAESILVNEKLNEFKNMNLSLDMTRGKPSPAQLDLCNDLYKVLDNSSFKTAKGEDCRNYGIPTGIEEARVLFGEILGTDKSNVFIGNASSLNLMFDTLMRAMVFGEVDSDKPWSQEPVKKWLCPVPGYDRHFRITETLGFELICVPLKDDGPDMDLVEKLVSEDESIKGMWTIPCYSNPDGVVYSEEVCKRLASMKTKAKDFRIYWDNAYCVHHLYNDESMQGKIPDILSLCAEAGNANRVYEFASTSKVTLAGSGLAVMACNEDNMKHSMKYINAQTICSNKINQLAHVYYLKNLDGVKAQMSKHAELLRPKFEMTLDILDKELSGLDIVNWRKPLGGYFVSVFVYPGTADKVVKMCKEMGVAFTPAGATFPYGKDPDDSNIRIAPSFPSIEDIEKAVTVFALCCKACALESLLA